MSRPKKAVDKVLPGDFLAISEEFLPGPNARDDSGAIKSTVVGTVKRDTKNMEISVDPAQRHESPAPGASIIGHVEVLQSGSAGIKLYYLNGRPTYRDFSGSLSLRSMSPRGGSRGGPRMGSPVRLGDIVRCRVFSLMNGIIHLSLEGDEFGVVYAQCGNCGRPMARGGSKAKCDECGNVEDRKLAEDFGRYPIRP